MNVHPNPQIIEHEGQPLFVVLVLPYAEYLALTKEDDGDDLTIPWEVSKIALVQKKSLIRAWREYMGLTKQEVAKRAGISLSGFAQIEANKRARPHRSTLLKIADALGVQLGQLQPQEERKK